MLPTAYQGNQETPLKKQLHYFCLLKVIFYGFYYGKSQLNDHLGRFSSTTLSKSKVMICLAGDGFQLFIYHIISSFQNLWQDSADHRFFSPWGVKGFTSNC